MLNPEFNSIKIDTKTVKKKSDLSKIMVLDWISIFKKRTYFVEK